MPTSLRAAPDGPSAPDPSAAVAANSGGPVSHRPATVPASAALAASLTIILWASAFVVIRDVGAELSPGPMALARLAVAALVLTPFAIRGDRPLLPRGSSLVRVVAYGVMWFAGYNLALNTAEQHIDAGTAALLVNLAPLLIAVGAGALLGEGFPRPVLVGSGVALGGVAIMAIGARSPSEDISGVGVTLGIVAAVFYAASVLLQKVTLRDMDGFRAIWLGCVIGVIALLPYTASLLDELRSAPASAVTGTVYLGAFPTAVAFTTWAYALRRMPAGRLAPLVGYLVTVLAVLMSWVFLSEVPTVSVIAGGVVCLAGVTISQRRSAPRAN